MQAMHSEGLHYNRFGCKASIYMQLRDVNSQQFPSWATCVGCVSPVSYDGWMFSLGFVELSRDVVCRGCACPRWWRGPSDYKSSLVLCVV